MYVFMISWIVFPPTLTCFLYRPVQKLMFGLFFSIFFFKLMPTSLYYSSGTNNHWQMTLGQVEHIHLTCCPYLYYFFHSGHSSRPPKSCRAAWFYYFKITNHIFFCQLLWVVVLITVELCHRWVLKKRKKWKLSTSKKNGGVSLLQFCAQKTLYVFSQGSKNYSKAVSSTTFCMIWSVYVLHSFNKYEELSVSLNK